MFNRILVVLENEEINAKAIYYARELAQRMDAEVSFLMLVEMDFLGRTWLGSSRNAISGLEDRVGRQMAEISSDFLRLGMTTGTALRVGEPKAELFKYLAERRPFQGLIWGSHEELPGVSSKPHWLTEVASSLECPLWTVSDRRRED